jgi:hypothetical protein
MIGQTQKQPPEETQVAVSVPWYKRIFYHAVRTETRWYLTFLIFFVVGIIVVNYINNTQQTTSVAGTNKAAISLIPKETALEKETPLQIWITTDGPVTSIATELSFDPTRLRLTGDIVFVDKRINRIVRQTLFTNANTAGKLSFEVVSDSRDANQLPQGTFHLATVSFTPSSISSEKTVVGLSAATKITGLRSSLFSVTPAGSTLIQSIK